MTDNDFPMGQRVSLPGRSPEPVVLEGVRYVGKGVECPICLRDRSQEKAILSPEESQALVGQQLQNAVKIAPTNTGATRLAVKSGRICLACALDPHFAVSLSGIRTLPHLIQAVHVNMLARRRRQFLLADDFDTGKAIMAGSLLRELKVRGLVERTLIRSRRPRPALRAMRIQP